MKKYLGLIVLLSSLLALPKELFEIKENSNEKIVLSLKIEDYDVKKQNNFSEIIVESNQTASLVGDPLLPSFSSYVLLDKNYNYDITYEVKRKKQISGVNIIPNIDLEKEDKLDDNTNFNDKIYKSNDAYPINNINESQRFSMRGNEFVNLQITPFKYFPIAKTLDIFEEVEISITKTNFIEEPISRDFPKSKTFDRLINSLVVNPINNDTRNDDYQQPHILYVCGGNTSTNVYMNQLVQWRRKQGYKVTVVSTSVIGDGSEQVKNYLEDSMDWVNPPEHVTLVGDVGGNFNIGSFTEYDSGYYGEGDHPFSQLDGNDLWPEVALGRISVRSTGELAVVVSKILGYEQASDMQNNWFEKARIVGDPSTSGISCTITAENIAEKMEDYGMQDVDLKISGGNYDDYMEDALSEGVNYLNYRGWYGVSGFGNNNVDGASSAGFKLPFATIITCGTGSFSSENQCLSEKFLRAGSTAQPKGAVACIGTATTGTHTMYNNAVNIGVYAGLFSYDLQTAGEALVAGKTNLYQNYPSNQDNWVKIFMYWNNLMGDSATRLWTGTPVTMNVEYEENLNAGQNFVSVSVSSNLNAPVENALITLIDENNDNFYAQSFTDENGEAIVNFDPSSINGDIELTINKFGHKPHMGTLNFNSNQIPYANSLDISDDGRLNVGEPLEINVPIYYNGEQTFNNVTATISSDGNVDFENTTISYDTIENGVNLSNDNFSFTLNQLQLHNSEINFTIAFIDDEGNQFDTNLIFDVNSFELEIIDVVVVNDNNGNGRLDPGESSNIYLTYENNGSLNSPLISCNLQTLSDDLIIVSNEIVNLVPIQPGTSANSPSFTTINLEESAFNGETKIIDISCEASSGFQFTENGSLQVGQTTVSDTTLDDYGYYIYDYSDSSYSLMPTYEWIDIEDIGSPLNDVNDDDGDNQDEVQTISIPFTFNFYGESYDEISVSSNGWISFGETELESFRNDLLPGPGGPSPMLAVFWDDLTADQGGEVLSYYDNILNVFIVQWNNVKTYEDNSNESFQAILFDPQYYTTPTGDGEILLQYEDFNNSSNGGYVNGAPVHGGYCSIGIEDHTGLRGLQYTFNNSWARTARPLADQTAIFISTRKTGTVFNMAQPELDLSNDEFNFEIIEDEISSQTITLTNNGEEQSILSYDISTSPFETFYSKDNFGNHWIDSQNELINFSWIDVNIDDATLINFETNDQGVNIQTSNEISFYGNLYNQLVINPNGWIGFGDDNLEWSNGSLPNQDGPKNAILAFWDDLNPINNNPTCSNEASGNVYHIELDDKNIVWFNNVIRCGSNQDYQATLDFQIVIHSNDRIDINYRTMDGYLNSGTIGIQNENASDYLQVVYNSEYMQDELTLSFKPLPIWLSPIEDSQQLDYLEQINYDIVVDGSQVFSDDISYLIINSNSSDSPSEIVPISVISTPEPGLVGDINGDEIVNVLDVVVLVNIVLNGAEYDPNTDINDDGIVNVLDIVVLVNIVLNS